MTEATSVASRRRYRPSKSRRRNYGWLKVTPHHSIADVLSYAGKLDVCYLVGPRPGGSLDGFHRWRQLPDELLEVWTPGDHYLDRPDRPVLKFRRDDGHRLELHRAGTWFGSSDGYSTSQASGALGLLRRTLEDVFDPEATTLTTPSTTGVDLWLRSIPDGVEWPVLEPDVQRLIRATSGQGRWEHYADGHLCDYGCHRRPSDDVLPSLHKLDMRFGYAAMCRELGVGPVERDEVPAFDDPYRPGRYRVEFTVPDGWQHIGLLPVAGEDSRWHYPSAPGATFETWVEGAELLAADRAGWGFVVRERMLYQRKRPDGPSARPLDTWAQRLIKVRDQLALLYAVEDIDPAEVKLAAAAARMILITTIGTMHRPSRTVEREGSPREVPTTATSRELLPDGRMRWTEEEARSHGRIPVAHPEWSAAIYGRTRARLLHHKPASSGALTLPVDELVAIHQDAIYTVNNPGWVDDQRVGTFRLDGSVVRTVPVPRSTADIGELL